MVLHNGNANNVNNVNTVNTINNVNVSAPNANVANGNNTNNNVNNAPTNVPNTPVTNGGAAANEWELIDGVGDGRTVNMDLMSPPHVRRTSSASSTSSSSSMLSSFVVPTPTSLSTPTPSTETVSASTADATVAAMALPVPASERERDATEAANKATIAELQAALQAARAEALTYASRAAEAEAHIRSLSESLEDVGRERDSLIQAQAVAVANEAHQQRQIQMLNALIMQNDGGEMVVANNERRQNRRELIRAMAADSHSGYNSILTRSQQRSFGGIQPSVVRRHGDGHGRTSGYTCVSRQSYTTRRSC